MLLLIDCVIKLLIFDIGGVLIDFTETAYVHYLRTNFMPGANERELWDFVNPLISVMEYGKLRVPELERMVAKHFGRDKLDMHWVQGWREIAEPKDDVIGLVNKLSDDYKVVLLSNVSQSRFAEMRRSYLKRVKAKDVYVSYDIELRKPEPAIYRYVLHEEGVRPGEAVFVDNQIENVIGAEKEGIASIWFRDYDKLVRDLKRFGVSVP